MMDKDLECLSCIFNQVYKTIKRIDVDEKSRRKIADEIIKTLYDNNLHLPSPELYFFIYTLIRKVADNRDPYKYDKLKHNENAINLCREIEQIIKSSDDPLYTALKLAIASNIIDFGVLEHFNLEEAIYSAFEKTLAIDDYDIFKEELKAVSKILYFMDNAGEAVFDKLFIKEILKNSYVSRIDVVVREEPFINDVTMNDVKETNLLEMSQVSVLTLPVNFDKYVFLQRKNVLERWIKNTDIVIAKGQVNMRILNKYPGVYFALIVKCDRTAKELGVNVGDMVFRRNSDVI